MKAMRNVVVTLAWLVVPTIATGCASPCVDDGLGQKFCPTDDGADGEDADDQDDGTGDDDDDVGDSDTDDDPGDGNGDGESCPLLDVNLSPQSATVVLLVDQSGSMTEEFDTVTRWEAVQTTLIDPTTGVVATLQEDIRFGLSLYTGYPNNECPALTEAAPALNNYDAISTLFEQATPANDTPTGESLEAVATALAADPTPGEKHIVLATDGEPDSCDVPNPTSPADIEAARTLSVAAAASAFSNGIRTSVISVGGDIARTHLQDVANAGAGVAPGNPDAPYYQALDQQSLVDAFRDIISGVRECTLSLEEALVPSRADDCVFTINDAVVDYDEANGWHLASPTEVELTGSTCDAIQEGAVTIQMECDCDALED